MNLTDRIARTEVLPAGKTDHIIFDAKLKGFGLRIRAGGKRSWVAQYRFGRLQRRFNLGPIEVLPAAKARSKAADIFAKVRLGVDPQADRLSAHDKANETFDALVAKYLARKASELRPRSLREVKRHLEQHLGSFSRRSVHSITRANIAERISKIADVSGVVTANRVRSSLSALFSWAMREGLADENPVAKTNKAGEEFSRDRILTDYELLGIWNAADPNSDYGRVVRLLILTAQRREEVGGIADSELCLEGPSPSWVLPGTRSKNGHAHEVPLSGPAVAILKEIPRRRGRDLLFGVAEGKPFQGWSRSKTAIQNRMDLNRAAASLAPSPSWRLHDIRRTVATRMADLGILPHVVEAVLNHVGGSKAGVAGIYNRSSYSNEKRRALAMWAMHLEQLLSDSPSKVIALRPSVV